ncbi:hypothetical protein RclHR1_00940002 [Rhizophagus clarus]|uniref:Uncharacterized protein n=1 Tax=Rhizophagus clarus TaxID=94130 RepID=A0A2Z6S6H1_9GLOM|nr:hypothetical protein RclHR1_00940002 [Rhizophagus clarus]
MLFKSYFSTCLLQPVLSYQIYWQNRCIYINYGLRWIISDEKKISHFIVMFVSRRKDVYFRWIHKIGPNS